MFSYLIFFAIPTWSNRNLHNVITKSIYIFESSIQRIRLVPIVDSLIHGFITW